MPKPTILFVHGAWNAPEQYAKLTGPLREAGYEVLAPRLLSLGDQAAGKTWKDDAAMLREVVRPLFAEGREVVVVAHSYGGVPATHAIEGLEATEGRPGGFTAVVYMTAFCLPKGVDLYQATGRNYLKCMQHSEPYSGNYVTTVDHGSVEAFFNDVSEEEAKAALGLLEGQSQDSFETPVTFAASDLKIPATYIVCEKDGAIPVFAQEMFSEGMKVERVNAGHFPFFAEQDRIVGIVKQAAGA